MITSKEVKMYGEIFKAYDKVHPTGGSLHIVLEDQNWDIGSIHFCFNYATDKGDQVGALLADFLSRMPEKYLKELRDGYTLEAALIEWAAELETGTHNEPTS